MNTIESKIEIGIIDQDRQAVIALLKPLLADEFVLYVKARNFHWNVTGPNFSELHAFFQKQYEAGDENVDDIAERIRALGELSPGTMRGFLDAARLKEVPAQTLPPETMIELLLEDNESLARNLRKDLAACNDRHHDAGTGDFLTGLLEKHEKTAWVLRGYLTK